VTARLNRGSPKSARVMTAQPAVSDYISTILRAIDQAQNDPAQLRQLVYDIARTALGKQILVNYKEIGGERLHQFASDLETAIRQVEILARLESELLPDNSHIRLIGDQRSPLHQTDVVVHDPAGDENAGGYRQRSTAIFTGQTLPEVYRQHSVPEVLPPVKIWAPPSAESSKRRKINWLQRLELPIAVLMGFVINAVILPRSDFFREDNAPRPQQTAKSAVVSMPPTEQARQLDTTPSLVGADNTPHAPASDFPLPSRFGVYAASEGKLYELQPLAMRIPDPRVAISAMIPSPSNVTVPNGKLAILVYRRDLVSSAPDMASVRVVARVTRELKFTAAGLPKFINIASEWRVRSNSYEFGVEPLKDNPEMIVLRSDDPQFSLPPGRYVLVLKGQGYDFSVDGRITDAAQCLERTDVVGGLVYSECRDLR
jgi:hypothetical protein